MLQPESCFFFCLTNSPKSKDIQFSDDLSEREKHQLFTGMIGFLLNKEFKQYIDK